MKKIFLTSIAVIGTTCAVYAQTISATLPIVYNSGTGVISSQPASATQDGHITIGTQTIAGNKTFTADNIFISNYFKVGVGGGSQLTNAAIGYGALSGNSSGVNNTAIGYNALVSNTLGSNNIGIGYSALSSTSGNTNENIALGYATGIQLTGSYNTFIGNGQVAYTTTSGQYNSAFGHGSAGQLTTGSFNTLLGRASGQGIVTGNYNTIIGQNTSIGDVSNHIIIADGQGNNRIVIDNAGNVGIGTTTPDQKLTVNGGGIGFDWNSSDKKLYSPADGDLEWYTHNAAGVHGFAVSHQGTKMVYLNTNGNSYFNGGNLGIGTTSPIGNLDVRGASFVGTSDFSLGSAGSNLQIDQGASSGNTYSRIRAFSNGGTAVNNLVLQSSGGNVGIGTTSPTVPLDIFGKSRIYNTLGTNDYTFIGQHNGQLRITNGLGTLGSRAFEIALLDNGTGVIQANEAGVGYNNLALNPVSGNVGIGTTSPIGNLDVRGASFVGTSDFSLGSAGSNLQIDQGASSGNTYSRIRAFSNGGTAVNNLVLQSSGGNVAIGTTDPKGYKLAIAGNAIAESMTVKLQANWPDYAFKKDYPLMPLADLKTYIDKNQHLPEVPTAAQVEKDGLNLGEMNKILVKKVEELTLYLIEKDKKEKEQDELIKKMEQRLSALEKQ